MAQLVTKFRYLKPQDRQKPGAYAKYIATREGVEKIDISQKYLPATSAQKKLIDQIRRDFPAMEESSEYRDYFQNQTAGAAATFISRAIEQHAGALKGNKTYADYIALRPRAERFGSHGLFTDDGIPVQLAKVSRELNSYTGNIYTAILSLRREDAVRLGFDCAVRWRDLLRSQTQVLSDSLKIPLTHLRWYAAYHDEGHHPHVHLIAYSIDPHEGRLTKKGVADLRSALARDIFAQDLFCIYEAQTRQRDQLKQASQKLLEEILHDDRRNMPVETLLTELAFRLQKAKGKKQYGYLRPELKRMVNEIVDFLAKDDRIADLYKFWCQSREKILQIYDEGHHEPIPLSENREFRSIKNMVIQAALRLIQEEKESYRTEEGNQETDQPKAPDPATKSPHSAVLQLLRSLAHLLQSGTAQYKADDSRVDRKLRRKTQEKEQAHGLKHS